MEKTLMLCIDKPENFHRWLKPQKLWFVVVFFPLKLSAVGHYPTTDVVMDKHAFHGRPGDACQLVTMVVFHYKANPLFVWLVCVVLGTTLLCQCRASYSEYCIQYRSTIDSWNLIILLSPVL